MPAPFLFDLLRPKLIQEKCPCRSSSCPGNIGLAETTGQEMPRVFVMLRGDSPLSFPQDFSLHLPPEAAGTVIHCCRAKKKNPLSSFLLSHIKTAHQQHRFLHLRQPSLCLGAGMGFLLLWGQVGLCNHTPAPALVPKELPQASHLRVIGTHGHAPIGITQPVSPMGNDNPDASFAGHCV